MIEIDDNNLYYVGFSDGGTTESEHYICMYDEQEQVTLDWCKAVKINHPESDIVMLKLYGKLLKKYRQINIDEMIQSFKKY